MQTYHVGHWPWDEFYGIIKSDLLTSGLDVDTGHWQAMKDVPHTLTRELRHVGISIPISGTEEAWQNRMREGLNLPWAEDHFLERVSGQPLNPGEEYKNWPWYKSGVEDHKKPGKFSHTYMERMWPKYANLHSYSPNSRGRFGIRYHYGDLNDAVELLRREPTTRQAYVPIWFPEDTGAHHGERVPCTLGWHFLMRDNKLHLFYPMRSVDLYRYLVDDLYMAGRLAMWMLDQLVSRAGPEDYPIPADETDNPWNAVEVGDLEFFASSVHVFAGDLTRLEKDVQRFEKEYGSVRR